MTHRETRLPYWLVDRLFRGRYTYHIVSRLLVGSIPTALTSSLWRSLLKKHHDVEVGQFSYGPILHRSQAPAGTVIGNWCSVGRELFIRRRNHPIERISQHPTFYRADAGNPDGDTIGANADNALIIGHDVWIGDRVTILPSCQHIGNGSVIAAGAVVTRDVPPYAIVAGVPAKLLKYRFPPEVQIELERSRWWDLSAEQLHGLGSMMRETVTHEMATVFADACIHLHDGKHDPARSGPPRVAPDARNRH